MEETPLTAAPKTINLIELSDYIIDFQIIQLPTKPWVFALNIIPQSNVGLIETGDIIQDVGVANKVTDIQVAILYSRENYSQWEYAAEGAIDIIESLGFAVDQVDKHVFKVLAWDDVNQTHITKNAIFQDNEVKLERTNDKK